MTLTKSRVDEAGMQCVVIFSDDESYRYDLTWRWTPAPLLVAWMLNPSTATHEALDRTVSGLVKRAHNWAMGGVRVINLFALRATSPKVMLAHPAPVGPDNDSIVATVLTQATLDGSTVVAAWGGGGRHLARQDAALTMAQDREVRLHCLGTNKDGTPKHPLYVGHAARPINWNAQ